MLRCRLLKHSLLLALTPLPIQQLKSIVFYDEHACSILAWTMQRGEKQQHHHQEHRVPIWKISN